MGTVDWKTVSAIQRIDALLAAQSAGTAVPVTGLLPAILDIVRDEAERLMAREALLGEIMATFEVNRTRLQWTGDELRMLYELEQGWRRRYEGTKRKEADVEANGG